MKFVFTGTRISIDDTVRKIMTQAEVLKNGDIKMSMYLEASMANGSIEMVVSPEEIKIKTGNEDPILATLLIMAKRIRDTMAKEAEEKVRDEISDIVKKRQMEDGGGIDLQET